MEKAKKILKEFSIFAICLACFCGLFLYRVAVKADITTISETKLVQKIDADESFVVVCASSSSSYTPSYIEVVEKYLTKNRSAKIYYLNLDEVNEPDTFVSTYFGVSTADLENPSTYVFVNGEIYKSKTAAIGYYELDKLMQDFNTKK